MRNGKELIAASKEFTTESRGRSWFEVIITLLLAFGLLSCTFISALPIVLRLLCSIGCGLSYVRLFVIYHDFEHRAILQNSKIANVVMSVIGTYLLAPPTIWKRSHEHHHNNNSKLTISGIGSYPTVSTDRFSKLSKKEKQLYLVNRHPLTVIFGYFTLFVYWLNLKSFIQSPGKHLDSLAALLLHVGAGAWVWYTLGVGGFALSWFLPFFIAFGTGSYLFYAQHNFPDAKFAEHTDWSYFNAAIASTSFMKMNPVMEWFTGNIGYHHIHHLNSRIPFYRLAETHHSMPELKLAPTTSLNPAEMIRCFNLKLWDVKGDKMVTMKQFKTARRAARKLENQPAVV